MQEQYGFVVASEPNVFTELRLVLTGYGTNTGRSNTPAEKSTTAHRRVKYYSIAERGCPPFPPSIAAGQHDGCRQDEMTCFLTENLKKRLDKFF